MNYHYFLYLYNLVFPLSGGLRICSAQANGPVLLAVQIPPLITLDAHPRRVSQLHEELLGLVAPGAQPAVGAEGQVLAVGALQMHGAFFGAFHPDRLVVGLVALQLVRGLALQSDEALIALQHQDGPVDQVEVEPGVFGGSDVVHVGVQMAGLFGAQEFAVVGLE